MSIYQINDAVYVGAPTREIFRVMAITDKGIPILDRGGDPMLFEAHKLSRCGRYERRGWLFKRWEFIPLGAVGEVDYADKIKTTDKAPPA